MAKTESFFLGIDTSCYTTSCALIDQNGEIIAEERKLLEVPEGKRGLSQSNMVFQHSRALPILLEKLPKVKIKAIGASAFPRREEDSYMPAFLVGKGFASSLAHFLDCPLYMFSHQENHVLAALRDLEDLPKEPFMSLHVSGGTTELLYCKPDGKGLFQAELIGGTSDLNAGQFVDRVGVAMGLAFPAGPKLEELALKGNVNEKFKLSLTKATGTISFGGPESAAQRRIKNGDYNPNDLAAEVFECVACGLTKLIKYHQDKYNVKTLIAVGGVMSNSILRQAFVEFCKKEHIKIHFAQAKYSPDNATGNAFGALVLDSINEGNINE